VYEQYSIQHELERGNLQMVDDQYNYREFKTNILLSSGVESGVALNIVGHLGIALGARIPQHSFGRERLVDGSGIPHMGISKYPVIILKARPSKVRTALEQARTYPELIVADYPEQMLLTGHDDELAQALVEKDEVDLKYLGVAAYGLAEVMTEVFGRFSLWK
jgi:hypothetical protein